MKLKKSTQNTWLPLIAAVIGFFATFFHGIHMIFMNVFTKNKGEIQKNHLLDTFHYIFHDFPKMFWKKPTGIGIGRSIGSVCLFFFQKSQTNQISGEKTSPDTSSNTSSKDTAGFSLIEITLSVTVLSGLLIAAFMVFGDIGKIKNRALAGVDIYEQITISSNIFFTTIKQSGTLDYEEYFNRRMVGTTLSGGHYAVWGGFGNEGIEYFCRSGSGAPIMGSDGCFDNIGLNTTSTLQLGRVQRYGAYKNQFIDYNTNASGDGGTPGDQNGTGGIRGDDDDEDLGKGPPAFTGAVHELYLLKETPSGLYRNIFRLKYERDPFAPSIAPCNTETGDGTGCIGRLQMLQLEGRDYGLNHGIPSFSHDGIIDTWVCAKGYFCSGPTGRIGEYLPTGAEDEWVSLFSDDIHIVNLEFLPGPATKTRYAWKDPGVFEQSPNVRVNMQLGYGWKKRRLLGTQTTPTVTLSTTVNLYE